MIKSGIKLALLMAFIGMVIIGMVQPIEATGQDSSKDDCQDSQSGEYGQMSEKDSSSDCKTIEALSSKKEKIESMMEEELANESFYSGKMDQNNSLMKANLDCASLWLQKAIKLHEMHLMNPEISTDESNLEMMDQMIQADKYLTGEKTADMIDRAADNKSGEYKKAYIISALTRLDCSHLWLQKAMKLHEMHLKNPEKATNESNLMLMAHMVRANRYLTGEEMDMEMSKDVNFSQTNVDLTTLWLGKAIKLHEMYLEKPEAATSESQMRLMNHMVRARECAAGKNMDMEMMMDFEEDSASEMLETSPKEKMMHSMMMMHSMKMGEKPHNETMMDSMMNSMMMREKPGEKLEEKSANEGCYADKISQNASSIQAKMDGVCLCLEKAIKLHEMNLRNPEAATRESRMEMMKEMKQAHEYLTGEKMTVDTEDETARDKFAEWMNKKVEDESTECTNAAVGYGSAKSMDTKANNGSSEC